MKPRNDSYDIVICGGGAAGCVIASRLTESNPQIKVLVLEAGRNNRDDPQVREPIRFVSLLLTDNVKNYTTEPDPALPDNRQITFAQGNLLGGGSSVK